MYLRWHSNLLNGIKRAQSKYQEFISRVDSVMIILKRKKKNVLVEWQEEKKIHFIN